MTFATGEPSRPRLPVKQLFILAICRFAEPLVLTSVFPYLPEMIESFGVPQDEIAKWAGIISMAFSMAQAVTAIGWGRLSDYMGRKPVLLIGLCCTMVTSLLFGFSPSLTWAIVSRALAGAGSGNVGILRTVVAELVPEKELQPMAFSVMPMTWSLGSCFGPSIGGSLAVPTRQYPNIFGGSRIFEKFKFALPNLFAALFLTVTIVIGFLYMKETMEGRRSRRDYGRVLGQKLSSACWGRSKTVPEEITEDPEVIAKHADIPEMPRRLSTVPDAPTWAEVCTLQSMLHVLSYTLLGLHTVAFDQMIPVLLHYPVVDHSPENGNVSLPFKFTGGFGLDSGRIGNLFTAMGVIGIFAQFTIFPRTAKHYGVITCMRVASLLFPLVYILVPYCVLLETDRAREAALFVLMVFKVLLLCFAYPCTTIMLTNSARSVNILGTLNGLSVATSAIGRASGPFLGGSFFTYGVKNGYLILPWFVLGSIALLSHILVYFLKDLPGPTHKWADDEEEEQQQQPAVTEPQIVVLPSHSEAHSAQPTGLLTSPETVRVAKPYFDIDEETLTEVTPLLGGVGSFIPAAGEDTINIGGVTMTQVPDEADTSLLPKQANTKYGI